MKKCVNLLWAVFVLLNVFILFLSLLDCVKYIPTRYEGLPIMGDGLYYGFDGPITLPEPSYKNLFSQVWFGSIVCSVLFLFKKRVLHILGILVSLIQAISVVFYVPLVSFIEHELDEVSCSIGELHGKYELSAIGVVVGLLCLITFLYSIMLTTQYAKEKRVEER